MRIKSAILFTLLFGTVQLARAALSTRTGGGSDGNWCMPANWSSGTVPQNGDDLYFPDGVGWTQNDNNLAGIAFNSVTIGGEDYEWC